MAQLLLLCAHMTVVIHSFVTDSSLLDCCDLVVFQGISVSLSFWYHAVRLLLVSFILGDWNWNFL